MSTNNKKYFWIYKTTNLITNKIYIGQSTRNPSKTIFRLGQINYTLKDAARINATTCPALKYKINSDNYADYQRL